MRLLNNILALCPSLSLWTLTIIFSCADASAINPVHSAPPLPFQLPSQTLRNDNGRSWFSRARNNLIQNIWRIPSDDPLVKGNGKDSTSPGPPQTLLARYGGDLVLRFEIKSSEEAEALAEAVNVLFLDVWEFTTEWVDIRLSKDIVSPPAPTLGHLTVDDTATSGPIAPWPFAIVTSACSYSVNA